MVSLSDDFRCGRDKKDYLIGAIKVPAEESLGYRSWKVEKNVVMSWLLNSMTNEMHENFMYYKTTKEIWSATLDTYSNKDNTFTIFELKGTLHDLRQGEMSTTDYFSILTRY